jgi:hypothetical protein
MCRDQMLSIFLAVSLSAAGSWRADETGLGPPSDLIRREKAASTKILSRAGGKS